LRGKDSGAVVNRPQLSKGGAPRESALRWEHEWASAILETIATPIVLLDQDAKIAGFNRACEELTGYTAEEALGKPVWVLLAPAEVEAAKAVFAELRAGIFPNRHENHWVTKRGEHRLIAWSNTALLNRDGSLAYIVGTGVDITEQRRVETELKQLNQTLRTLVETGPLAIIGLDLEGNVTAWNRAAEKMFGWTEAEALHRFLPPVPEGDREFTRENLRRVRRGECLSGVERRRRRKDGSPIDIAIWNAPQRDAAGVINGVISVIADVTDRKRLEEQFRQSQKMEAVGRLAGGVAHDFNNLLTIINGYAQMAMDMAGPDHPLAEAIQEILRAGDSAAGLTSQLLAFSRRQVVQPRVVDLNTLITGMDKMLHRLIGEDIELIIVLGSGMPQVKVDPGQFQQVVMNLAVNSRDAMPNGGRLTIQTGSATLNPDFNPSPPALPRGEYAVLTVSDTGKGMSEETLGHLFEPFFTTKGKGKGTGLGLSTVYGIVKQAGGDVTVSSSLDAGTTFRIYLPVVEELPVATAEREKPARRTGTETVLLAEDDTGLRKLVHDVLRSHGYTVLEAAGPEQAISLCDAHEGPIHLFLSDVIMPRMGGRELAERVLAMRPEIRVLYMSGYTAEALPRGMFEERGFSFLQKPFTPELLLLRVRQALDGSRGE
jgi:two-component system cell cycle sensor histidine kinase/response regulator CckA